MELLIGEYQKNANQTPATLKVLEFYGGDEWRIDKGIEMSRCIQRLVEDELVQQYQGDLMPDEETRNALESAGGITWREDQGVEGRRCILRIIKEEQKNGRTKNLVYSGII